MVLKRQKSGFTLIELLVAMAIFSIAVGVAMSIFVVSIKSQRKVLARQQLLEQTSYALEYISRALRMAKKDLTGVCLTTAGAKSNYETDVSANRIRFLNYENKCQEFLLESNQLKEKKSSDSSAANFGTALPLTSSSLTVNFKIIAAGWPQSDGFQPATTLILNINSKEQTNIIIQTTISQRNLDVEY
jgi:prepilin-type N-terminal cleavage/methylation domain-containing protein